MTRCAEEDTRKENIDLRVLVDYIKIDLVKKAKFVLGKDEWDVGGRIYNDFIKCCNGRIGLQTMTDVVRERYMETIWMKALTKNIQKKALHLRGHFARLQLADRNFLPNYPEYSPN